MYQCGCDSVFEAFIARRDVSNISYRRWYKLLWSILHGFIQTSQKWQPPIQNFMYNKFELIYSEGSSAQFEVRVDQHLSFINRKCWIVIFCINFQMTQLNAYVIFDTSARSEMKRVVKFIFKLTIKSLPVCAEVSVIKAVPSKNIYAIFTSTQSYTW